ncbi:class I SAM-dependent methyltransferase [Pikeienuella piscinae]|uniref:Class I SAM-dependent methyltransferase n=1 Tax=Pikeienuella piscinae TaxID=2748098 RepID=A0A7L5BYG0_9RHOB|nr:class I SAM-dependent methyltransferase [Pikeienuella piscinae]QIE55276.1 class I SAM-dependent methyltransferase [Pikeienuella piscinae]
MRELPHTLTEKHLSDCKAYPDRLELISSFGRGGVVAEVGVARGSFSQSIFNATGPERLILIDYWREGKYAHGKAPNAEKGKGIVGSDYEHVKSRFSKHIESGRVRLIRDWSWGGLKQIEDAQLDWVYIDAGHDFDSVTKDLMAVLPKMKPGGIIAGHDYVRWGRFGYRCGVIEAVTKFCVEQEFKIIGLTFERQYPPSYALQKI